MKKYITGLLLLASTSLVVAADKVKKIPYEIPIGPTELYFSGAPEVLYCRFPTLIGIRHYTWDQEISQDAWDGKALVKVGRDRTIVQQGRFHFELKTLMATSLTVHAASLDKSGVHDFYADLDEGYALWTDSWSGLIEVYRGNCSSFKE